MPVISALTYTKTDTTISAAWTTDVSADSNLSVGGKAAIDNGVAANGTSHQCIVTGLNPSTGYPCFVTSGGSSSSTTTQTTTSAPARTLITSAKNGSYTQGNHANNPGDTQRTFLSNDTFVYVTQDDGTGITSGSAGTSCATAAYKITSEGAMTGGTTLLNTYGASSATNGTDGPGGIAMTNKSTGLFGLNGNLHMFVYRQNPATGFGRYCNWIKSTDHGATWNNFNDLANFVSGGNPVTPNSPAEPVQFYDLTIGLVVPVLYAADDGGLGYTTAGNLIDGGNAFVYMNYVKDTDATKLYMMRIPRIQFDAQNAAAIQYWKGAMTFPTPLDFTNDGNWSNANTDAVNFKPVAGTQTFNTGLWNQMAFVPAMNSYILSISGSYDGSGRTLWQAYSAPTPVGPWNLFFTQPFSLTGTCYNGFFPFHRDIAGNVATSDITSKFLQSVDETIGSTHYAINFSTLTMQPSSGATMVQQAYYGFTTVENPLSYAGNFTANSGMSPLKVVSSGQCEASVISTHCGAYWSSAVPSGDTGGTWPADHYSELTIAAGYSGADTTGYFIPIVRQSAGANTDYRAFIQPLSNASFLYAVVAGTTHLLATFTTVPVAQDVWRLSVSTVAGNAVLTLTQNGATIQTFTDTNNFVAGPGFPSLDIFAATLANEKVFSWAAGANQASAPTFSPGGGSYGGTQTVTITGPGSSTIYYTTDGSTPTRSSSSIASGATVSITATKTLKAIASLSTTVDSQITGALYNISILAGNAGSLSLRRRKRRDVIS